MRVKEHLVKILLIVKRVLSLEEFIEFVDRLVKALNALILHVHSQLVVSVLVNSP
jgi:hypothetical protein